MSFTKKDLKDGMLGVFIDDKGYYCGVFIGNTFITKYGGYEVDYYYNNNLKVKDQNIESDYMLYKVIQPSYHKDSLSAYRGDINFWFNDAKFLEYPHKVLWENKKDVLNFKKFLIDADVDWKLFLKNCYPENQRWVLVNYYHEYLPDIKDNINPENWIDKAFNREHVLQYNYDFWAELSSNWYEKVQEAKENDIKIVWE